MSELDSVRGDIKQSVLSWLDAYAPGSSDWQFEIIILLWIAFSVVALHYFLHVFVQRAIVRFANKGQSWHRALLTNKLFRNIAFIVQGVVVHMQAGIWFGESSTFIGVLIEGICEQWILLFSLFAFFSLLNSFQDIMLQRVRKNWLPIRGLIQTVKLVACVLAGLLAISIMLDKSPVILLSGLGALSAVFLLVFKDPILGLVAGIQLSANNMLSVGDWLEMPQYGADGDVIDIALTTVKVQNWDKTITTIPTYALISDSFKNWRGMSESGGRRIKRSILIETSSIRFLDDALRQHLKKAELLSEYLKKRVEEIENSNRENKADMSIHINGRRLTNVGTFRAYLVSFLQAHPHIHQGLTLMVRQLSPTSDGLPIEIYAFTNTTKWTEYEEIQSDIFDHIFSVLSEFDLRAHESPTGNDVRFLIEKKQGKK
jgi:miniconductance mechanosensitive channel